MFLIVNPLAGKGRAKEILPLLLRILERKRAPFDLAFTSQPGEATQLAKEAVCRGFEKIVAVGGDGTVSEVAQGLINTGVPLGIIPAGVGNDFARALGIPLTLQRAVEIIFADNLLDVDVGRVGFRCFVNVLGVGFDAQVTAEAQKSVGLRGSFAYVIAALKEIFAFRTGQLALEMAGWQYSKPTLMAVVANGRSEGRYFRVTPRAQLNDGLLDVCVIEAIPSWQRVLYALMAFGGWHLLLPKTHYKKTDKLKIILPPGWQVHLDGEVINQTGTKLEIGVLPKSLKVLVGVCPEYRLEKAKEEIKAPWVLHPFIPSRGLSVLDNVFLAI